jgi:hypothetical protein
MRCTHKVFVGKPEEKRTLGRPRRKREDNIKADFKGISLEGIYSIDLTHGRDHVNEPWDSIQGGEFLQQLINHSLH